MLSLVHEVVFVRARQSWIKVLLVIFILDIALIAAGYAIYRFAVHTDVAADIQVRLRELEKSIDLYYVDCKMFPTEDQGLEALRFAPEKEPLCPTWQGPYADNANLMDPWGRAFIYGRDGDFYSLRSLGADGAPGGDGVNSDLALEDL